MQSNYTPRDSYVQVTDRIIELLEKGTIPWHKPWNSDVGRPRSLATLKPYHGINLLILGSVDYQSPFWVTFNEAKRRGGFVKKGQSALWVVFWKWIEVQDEKEVNGIKLIPLLKSTPVFNTDQTTLQDIPKVERAQRDIPTAESIIANMQNPPQIFWGGVRACYQPGNDAIHLPVRAAFDSDEEYYSTLFHEMTHATGHEKRLDRDRVALIDDSAKDRYSKEELIAEMGSAFLMVECGIENTLPLSAGYISGWLRVLKNDKRIIVYAAANAQRAVDYILGKEKEGE